MRHTITRALPIVVVALAMLGSQTAQAEDYHVVNSDQATSCQAGTKTDWLTLQGPRDISIARADGDKLNVAVCVADDSPSNMHVQWKANGYWKSSGNIRNGCAEILGASAVKIRPVNTNFHENVTYFTCVKE